MAQETQERVSDGLTVGSLIQMWKSLKSERGKWESHWQDVADFVCPVRSNITNTTSPGDKRVNKLVDNTAVRANERFASMLFSYMTRPDEQWFKLQSVHPEISKMEEVKAYFNRVEQAIMKNMYLSNFALEIHEDFLDLGSIGTSNIYIEAGDEYPLRFQNIPIRQYCIEESAYGQIDTVFHEFKFNAKQAVQKFGYDTVSDKIKECYDNPVKNQGSKRFTFLHCVTPRRKVDHSKKGAMSMPFASYYIEVESKKLLSESGYESMPYIVGRFMKDPDEIYGRSPAINALADIKMLNGMVNTMFRSAEKRCDPPMLVADNSLLSSPRFDAGSLLFIRGSMFQDKPIALDTKADVGLTLEMVQRVEKNVEETFYMEMSDELQDKKYMTATEVNNRRRNKLMQFAPMSARIQAEKLSKIVQRCYIILQEQGLLPEMPQILQQNPNYEISFVGQMALAMKTIDKVATQQTLGLVSEVAQVKPDVYDHFNFNEIIRNEALENGMTFGNLRTQEEVDQIRADRAKQQEEEAQMRMAQQGADVVNKLQQPTQEGSPLQMIANNAG